jgi:tetratricopeptide (TPR) repeat protein
MLVYQLGAYETDSALLLEFFPGSNTRQEPQVSDPKAKRWILNEVGFCLMNLGRLGEAVPFFERSSAIDLGMEDWDDASRGYINLAELHAHLGALAASADAAREALALARRAENKEDERNSLAHQAWAAYLRGDLEAASAAFQQAEALEREIVPAERYLYSQRGIRHANYLRRAGDAAYARRVTAANLKICEQQRWPDDLSRSHRVLGDLDADAGQHESSRQHYDAALKIARGITRRDILIEALLARGHWAAQWAATLPQVGNLREVDQAFSDLNEALGYAVTGGYRIYEADIRTGLAWAHLAAALTPGPSPDVRRWEVAAARAEAERARQMSAEMGYHWGQVDAAEMLAVVEQAAL